MPARLRLSWDMKTLKLFLLPVLESFEFGCQVIGYALIFVSAFFRQRTSLACEMVAIRSQLTFYEESIRRKRQPRPRFNPAFRLLWVLLSTVWSGWKSAAELMKCRWRVNFRREIDSQLRRCSYPETRKCAIMNMPRLLLIRNLWIC